MRDELLGVELKRIDHIQKEVGSVDPEQLETTRGAVILSLLLRQSEETVVWLIESARHATCEAFARRIHTNLIGGVGLKISFGLVFFPGGIFIAQEKLGRARYGVHGMDSRKEWGRTNEG